jgi:hypothetical protein
MTLDLQDGTVVDAPEDAATPPSAIVPTCSVTIMRSVDGAVATKTFWRDGAGNVRKEGYGKAKFFAVEAAPVSDIVELGAVLGSLEKEQFSFVIRGELVETASSFCTRRLIHPDPRTGDAATFRATNRRWMMLDFDAVPCPASIDTSADPEGAVEYLIGLLPQEFHDASCWWQWSSSQGMDGGATLRAHLWFWLSRPIPDADLKRWAKHINKAAAGKLIDEALFSPVQPHYVGRPIFGHGVVDPVSRRSGLRRGLEDEVELDIPAPQPCAAKSGRSIEAGLHVAVGFEEHLAQIGADSFREPIKSAIASYVAGCTDPDAIDREALKAAIRAAIGRADPGDRSPTDIERYKSDEHLDSLIDWTGDQERGKRQELAEATIGVAPYYPACDTPGSEAAEQLRDVIESFFDNSEKWLRARDEYEEMCAARIGFFATKKEKREIRKQVRAEIREKHGIVDFKNAPRLQIAGDAGLGKTRAIIEDYLRRHPFWRRHIHMFVPTIVLAQQTQIDIAKRATLVAPLEDGARPRALLHRGRDHEAERGHAPCKRHALAKRLGGKVMSVYAAICSSETAHCPYYAECEYLRPYKDDRPALRLFAHDHLTLQKPLKLPRPDIVIVDENSTSALIYFFDFPAAALIEAGSYLGAETEGDRQEAVELGNAVLRALSSGQPILSALRQDPRCTAKALKGLAKLADKQPDQPLLKPDMVERDLEAAAGKLTFHVGSNVARMLRQLAAELRHERDNAHGVACRKGDVHVFRRKRVIGAPKSVPLLIIDADADLEINRALFGPMLEAVQIRAQRRGRVVQAKGTILSKRSLVPDASFEAPRPEQVERAAALRRRLASFIRAKSEEGHRVLAVTNLPVRKAFTGETEKKVPLSIEWGGATWTHYGRVLGVNDWSDYDVVILLGREQMRPSEAEKIARAVYCDSAEPLQLTGTYQKEIRGHRFRDGSRAGARVDVHPDRRVQAIVERTRERGMCQAIDRMRLIHGRPGREIYILCDLPLPGVTIDRYLPLDEILEGGTRYDRAWRAKGILSTAQADLHQLHPDLWPSAEAAKKWLSRFPLFTGDKLQIDSSYYNLSLVKKVEYRKAGRKGGPCSVAVVDAGRHLDPRAALEAELGPLADCRVVECAPKAAASTPEQIHILAPSIPNGPDELDAHADRGQQHAADRGEAEPS